MKTFWRWMAVAVFSVGAVAALAAGHTLLGTAAPDFALRAFDGSGNVRLSEHRGEVVVLSFWGSGCATCSEHLATLGQSLATYQTAGLQVFAVNVDDNPQRAQLMADAQEASFRLLSDPRKDVSRAYRVDNLPMTLLIDRAGVVRRVYRDFDRANAASYLQELRALLNE